MFNKFKVFIIFTFCICISIFACSCGSSIPDNGHSSNSNPETTLNLVGFAICSGDNNLTKLDAEKITTQNLKYSENNEITSTYPLLYFIAHKNNFMDSNFNNIYYNSNAMIFVTKLNDNNFNIVANVEVPIEPTKFFVLVITSDDTGLKINSSDEIVIDSPKTIKIESKIKTNLKSIKITIKHDLLFNIINK